jgi:hypothetical protein
MKRFGVPSRWAVSAAGTIERLYDAERNPVRFITGPLSGLSIRANKSA